MSIKPDFAITKQNARTVFAAYQRVQNVLSTRERVKNELNTAAAKIYHRSFLKVLEETPLDRLGFGSHEVPVDLLKNAGFTNCAQVHQATYAQLQAVPGMDGRGLQKVFDGLDEVRKAAHKKSAVRVRVDHPDQEQTELITALCRYETMKVAYQEGDRLLYTYGRCVTEDIPASERITNGAKWFFSSKEEKETVSKAAKEVNRVAASELIPASVRLESDWANAKSVTHESAWQSFVKNAAWYYAELEQFIDEMGKEAESQGRVPIIPRKTAASDMLPTEIADQVEAYELDTSRLNATLRNYQNFGTKYMLTQQKVLLGDEMGLGKTVQAIGAMSHLYAQGARHFLVIAPASVLVNWTREIEKFSELTPRLLHGLDMADNLILWYKKGGVGVTNFETVSRLIEAEIPDLSIDMLVVDEAHFVKNPKAKRTMGVKELSDKAAYTVFMTGTPLENNVDEMRNLIGMLQTPLKSKLPSDASQFEKMACSVYLRRTRADVLSELPEKTETIEWCELGREEKKAYNKQIIAKNFMGMRQVSWDVADLKDSSKAQRLKEIVEAAREDGRKVLVFSYFLGTLNKVMDLFGEMAAGPIDGSVPTDERQTIIDEFSGSETQHVLVCQSISGGTGLNIQSASVVVFCEPQIKPSIETQAIARSYRMGQAHDVLVYRLMADDTVDERIKEILEEKQAIFDTYAERSLVGSENLKRISDDEPDKTVHTERDASQYQKEIIEKEIERIQKEDPEALEQSEEALTKADENVASENDVKAPKDLRETSADTASSEEAKNDKPKRTAKPKEKKDKLSRAAKFYPEGDLIPMGSYIVGETLLSGDYFIRVQDSREKAAEISIYENEAAMEQGQPKRELSVENVHWIHLEQGEAIRLVRADLVRAR